MGVLWPVHVIVVPLMWRTAMPLPTPGNARHSKPHRLPPPSAALTSEIVPLHHAARVDTVAGETLGQLVGHGVGTGSPIVPVGAARVLSSGHVGLHLGRQGPGVGLEGVEGSQEGWRRCEVLIRSQDAIGEMQKCLEQITGLRKRADSLPAGVSPKGRRGGEGDVPAPRIPHSPGRACPGTPQ